MILISNICIMIATVLCLLFLAVIIVAKNLTKKATNAHVIIMIIIFLVLVGAVMPRLYIWLF